MNNHEIESLEYHKRLAKDLNKLANKAEPSFDLWPDIERNLDKRETKTYTPNWMSMAIAATLVVSFCAAMFSWTNLQQAKGLSLQSSQFVVNTNNRDDIQGQIDKMEQAYGLAKSALLAQINSNAANNQPDILSEIETNLIIIEQATTEIKQAMGKQPNNPSLPKLLKATYQQELVVLTQLAKLDLNG
jgi:hypothetical protein